MCKGEPRPSRSYRIVEEIRLVQVSQVQEAGSREQPVGREGFQDGVHRAGFQETPLRAALPSLQGGGDPRTELRLGRVSSPRGRSRRAPGEERRGWRGSGALGTLKQRRRTHRGHSADSSSSSSRGAAGFHGDSGGGADARGAPRGGWEPGVGELSAPPRQDGCRISLGLVLGTASVTFPGLKPGTRGWLAQLARAPRPHINIHDNSILMSRGVAGGRWLPSFKETCFS